MSGRDLYTIQDFCSRHEGFSEGFVRWLRYRSKPVPRVRGKTKEILDPNGFGSAFVRVAGRVFVDEAEFFKVVDSQNRRCEQ